MKNVLITGGSRGIGREMVLEFCRNGYNTYFFYCSDDVAAKKVMEESGASGIKCNVSDCEMVKQSFDIIRKSCNGIDILINNAGISQIKPFLDISYEEWTRMMNVHLNGTFNCCKEGLQDMLNQKWGRVVNISSMWGQVGASCEVHYSAAKAGIIGMTKALALEFALSGVTVNCIAPGIVDTDMNKEIDKEDLRLFVEDVPLGRMCSGKEIADLAVYLCSDRASYITGQVIGVNGGMVM